MIADPMVTVLSRLAQEELADVAARRADEGKSPLSLPAQRALATKVVTAELGRIDQQRLASGELRLSELEEARITEEVVASSTGLGAVDVMLNDETIEEIVATRFDLLFTYHSDGSVRRVERPPWSVESEMVQWLSFPSTHRFRCDATFWARSPCRTWSGWGCSRRCWASCSGRSRWLMRCAG
jgi:hypothetical protein